MMPDAQTGVGSARNPCRFKHLTEESGITNLPTREFVLLLQRREPGCGDILRSRLRIVHVEVAVADEDAHHREVRPVAPLVHLESGKVLQSLSHDFSPGGHCGGLGAAAWDMHVPHQKADPFADRKLRCGT